MDFSYSQNGDIGIYRLKGNLIGENDGIAITDSFNSQIDSGTENFIISMEELKHINSSGLGVLITLLTKARKKGGELILAQPSDFIRNLLLITKLNTIFRIYDSEQEALEAYQES